MKHVKMLIFCLILWSYEIHGKTEHLKLHRKLARHHQIQRNVISNDILSLSDDNTELMSPDPVRIARDLSSIYCKTDSDCKRFSANSVCMYYTPLSISFCLQNPDSSNTATSMTYSMYMISALIVFSLFLRHTLI